MIFVVMVDHGNKDGDIGGCGLLVFKRIGNTRQVTV